MNSSNKSPRNCFVAAFCLRKRTWAFVLILHVLIYFFVFHQYSEQIYVTNVVTKWIERLNFTIEFAPTSMDISEADFEPGHNQSDGITYNSKSDLACPIPQLKPFPNMVKDYMKSVIAKDEKIGCDKLYPKLFESTLDGNIVPVIGAKFKSLGFRSCCYQRFRGGGNGSWSSSLEKPSCNCCYPLSLKSETKIPKDIEFIRILCEKPPKGKEKRNETVDLHSFIRINPKVEKRLNKVLQRDRRSVNVVIFGIDSYSRMSFHRFMPKSRAYLRDELGAVELKGYNKLGLNTYPCIIPLLTNLNISEAKSSCVKERKGKNGFYYDDCPLIWKLYAKKGYRTSYAEDYSHGSIFGGNRDQARGGGHDFFNSPTDYDFKAYSVAASQSKFPRMCYGPRLSFKVLLDHIKKLMHQMKKIGKPYFHFTWATGLTHGNFAKGKHGDKPLLEMLKWMKNSGNLKETVFIIMGDHGLGEFRNTIQGQIEDRLPLLSLVLPDWMKAGKYSKAFQNLLGNRERLMTVFDLHQVLLDILNLEGMENSNIGKREMELSNFEDNAMPRGISLFLPIPKQRTCEMADIPPEFCACKLLPQLRTSSSAAEKAAKIAVEKINSILSSSTNCSTLSLSSVIKAGYDSEGQTIQVNFQTQPGNATFEALVGIESRGFFNIIEGNNKEWEVIGTISRTNSYGNQSHCIQDELIKSYCYCT